MAVNEPVNALFELAKDFVLNTSRHVFLTGKAGTGKTTFLKYIKTHTKKKTVVVAPTGVAAINAGGTTLHSFFQLPFGAFIPGTLRGFTTYNTPVNDPHSLIKNLRIFSEKRKIFRELELLIIDEISMVRADLLDAVDTILRHFRRKPFEPFGGVQVLYIGDLFQLPPVTNDQDWELLREYYASPFFFESYAVRQARPMYVELQHIYRQSDPVFVGLLNEVRNGKMAYDSMELLNARYNPEFRPVREEGYITLSTHNRKTDIINAEELEKLITPAFNFEAKVDGDFSDKSYPTDKVLQLKEGAQIMFLKNDIEQPRRFYNGKIAQVESIGTDQITVSFPGEPDMLKLEKETWKNIKYAYHTDKGEIVEEEMGSFTQYPIRLAWAITIHKSQGLTFDKAIIDAGAAFAPGQVYVALSRCRSLEGIVLRSRILPESIRTDEQVLEFANSFMGEEMLAETLKEAARQEAYRNMIQAFDWSAIQEQFQEWLDLIRTKNIPDVQAAAKLAMELVEEINAQKKIADKFQYQLRQMLEESGVAEHQLRDRVAKAAAYFNPLLQNTLLQPLKLHREWMKTKPRTKKYVQELEALEALLTGKTDAFAQALARLDAPVATD